MKHCIARTLLAPILATICMSSAMAGKCDDALAFALIRGSQNTAVTTCKDFKIGSNHTHINASCKNASNKYVDTAAKCSNIVDHDINSDYYALTNQDGYLSSSHECSVTIQNWTKTTSEHNSSPRSCDSYFSDAGKMKAKCRNATYDTPVHTYESCSNIWDKAMQGNQYLKNKDGNLTISKNP